MIAFVFVLVALAYLTIFAAFAWDENWLGIFRD